MSQKPKKQLLRALRTSQKMARELSGRLAYRNGVVSIYSGSAAFPILLDSRDVSWTPPDLMEFGSSAVVTPDWVAHRSRRLHVWRELMSQREVQRSAREKLSRWRAEVDQLSKQATLLGQMYATSQRINDDDSIRKYPDGIGGYHGTKSGLLLSAGQVEFVNRLKQQIESDGVHQLPDRWFDILQTVVWCTGNNAGTRFIESLRQHIPAAKDVRRSAAIQRVLDDLRRIKSLFKTDTELAQSEFERQFCKWPLDVVSEANLYLPARRLKLSLLKKHIGSCHKLLKTIRSMLPIKLVSKTAALCCSDTSTVPVPSQLYRQNTKNHAHPSGKSFSLRIDYMHDHAHKPRYDEMLRALEANPEIYYGFEYDFVRRLLCAGTSHDDLRWLVQRDLFDSLSCYDVDVKPLRQVYELLEASGARPSDERMADLCEAIRSRQGLMIYQRLAEWLQRLPDCILSKDFAKRVRSILTTTCLPGRLGDICRAALHSWESPPRGLQNRISVPDDCPADAIRPIAELAYYQKMSGEQIRLPGTLSRLIFAATRRTKELASLQRLQAHQPSHKVQARLDHLNRTPLTDQSEKIIRLAQAARAYAGIAALEKGMQSVGDRWWNKHLPNTPPPASVERLANVCGWFVERSTSQQTSIQEVLRVHAERSLQHGIGVDYRRHLIGNQKWIASMVEKGFRPERWFADRRAMATVGDRVFRIEVSTDPMLTMRMGDLFNTCLNLRDGCNRYSVVANLYDANKAVIFAFDESNPIVRARKLVTITDDGRLLPYYTYLNLENDKMGDELRQEIDFFCGEWACEAGLTLGESGVLSQISHDWYDDGCIDWMEGAKHGFTAQTTRMHLPMNSGPISLVASA